MAIKHRSRNERHGWRYFSDKTADISEEDEDDDVVFDSIKEEADPPVAPNLQQLIGDGKSSTFH